MARPVNKKPFYLALALIAVAGVTAIWLARGPRGGRDVGSVQVTAEAFDGHVVGSDSAPVTVVEYSSFGCSHCAQFAVLTKPDVMARYINTGRVLWKYRDFPIGAVAETAHHAAACADEQGAFWAMYDQLFRNQGRWATNSRPERALRDLARAANLDLGAYDACMASGRYAARIAATRQSGVELGVHGTPTFIINGRAYSGAMPFDQFRQLLDQAESAAR